jgi:hypothetical protein
MRIQAHDLLDIGTPVMVNDLIGTVINAEMVQAHPCGMICSHTIRFTKRRVWDRVKSGQMVCREVDIKPVERKSNYSFINTIERGII